MLRVCGRSAPHPEQGCASLSWAIQLSRSLTSSSSASAKSAPWDLGNGQMMPCARRSARAAPGWLRRRAERFVGVPSGDHPGGAVRVNACCSTNASRDADYRIKEVRCPSRAVTGRHRAAWWRPGERCGACANAASAGSPCSAAKAYKIGDRFRFWGGSCWKRGPGLIEMEHAACKAGVEVRFEAKVARLVTDDWGAVTGSCCGARPAARRSPARAVVLAAGGFEANAEMRTQHLGHDWELAHVRGTPYNAGDGIRMALAPG